MQDDLLRTDLALQLDLVDGFGRCESDISAISVCDSVAVRYDVFWQWFEYQHHSMLIDLCDEPLIRD